MYPLYSDKPNLFECQIQLEGCSLNDASARLIIESNQNSLVFTGEIDNNGACLIPVKKLKGLVSENGEMKLEVIADDMYFSPWESEYQLKQSKKVTVEVKTPSQSKSKLFESNKPKINVTFKNPKPLNRQTKKRVVKENKSREFTKKDLTALLKRLRG
jgi:hypothetical protein